jgi:iron complex transport system ATP-binding protein
MTDHAICAEPAAGARNDPALRLSEVGHAYQGERWLFRKYSYDIPRGSVFSLLGPNGCGKTTLLKIILGVLRPTEGNTQTFDEMAFVPQLFQTAFDYTTLDMVLMGRAKKVGLFSQPSRKDEEAALAALARFSLEHLANSPFHELSGGQRQLVIFARALVAEARILILDEPASALDLKNQGIVLQWIRRLAAQEGITVIFTTHHPHHALAVADLAALMLGGEDYVLGPAATVLAEPELERLYGVPIRRLPFVHDGKQAETLVPVLTL